MRVGLLFITWIFALGLGGCTRDSNGQHESVAREAGRAAYNATQDTKKAAKKAGRELQKAAKDGLFPTDPRRLGHEVPIGQGKVDFRTVFRKLRALHYTGAITIERETSGPQQIEDVRNAKVYLEKILREIG